MLVESLVVLLCKEICFSQLLKLKGVYTFPVCVLIWNSLQFER